METRRRFEGKKNEVVDDFTAYERLLNQMYTADDDLPLKTELYNPMEFTRFYFIIQMIKDEGRNVSYDKKTKKGFLDDEAKALLDFGFNYMSHMVSKDRGGRIEGFDAIKSYNLGKLDIDDKDTEKFKRVIKDLK